MQAIRVTKFGDPDVLKVESNVPIPQPGENQVLIKVKSIGVNPIDVYIRTGTFSITGTKVPYTPGKDCAGIVEKVGKHVTDFKPGERVYTCDTSSGAYAEYTLAEAVIVGHLPSNVSFEEGAALGVPYNTAYRALVLKGNVRPGETVLVHGASGGVGIPCCQLARARGLTVLGTAGTKEGLELVKQNGANMAFNHREAGYIDQIMKATDGNGPDVIIEMIGSINLEKDMEIVRELTGRIMVVGSRDKIEVTPVVAMLKEVTIKGVSLLVTTKDEWKESHSYLQVGLVNGWLKPIIGGRFPLSKAADAHISQMEGSGKLGKILLTV